MSKITQFTTFILRQVWTFIAVVLVLFAILMSVVRYSLPYINEQKHRIEHYVQQTYGVDLSIGNIDAQWRASGPQLVLQDVVLPQSPTSPIELGIKNINVELDFWGSVANQKVVSKNFDLDGLNLQIELHQIEGSESEFPIVEALETLFLEQLKSFSINNSSVSVNTMDASESFEIERLTWLNKGDRHQGQGKLKVEELANNSAFFLIDLYTEGEQVNGSVYANAQALDLSPWINNLKLSERPLKEGRGNFELWANISNRRISKVYGTLSPSDFVWQIKAQDGQPENLLARLNGGTFVLEPMNAKWLFNIFDLSFELQDEVITTDIVGQYSSTQGTEFLISKPFSLGPIAQFAGELIPGLSEFSARHQPTAELNRAAFKLINKEWFGLANIDNLGWQESEYVPGVDQLQVELNVALDSINIQLRGDDLVLDSSRMFKENLAINSLDASITLASQTGKWSVSSERLNISLFDFDVNAGFTFEQATNQLSAFVATTSFDTNRIQYYLPKNVIGKGATEFLSRAFSGPGQVERGTVIWQGRLDGFPFANNQGVFAAKVDIKQSDFLFSSDWPTISDMDITLDFINNDLFMNATTGTLKDIALSGVVARIPLLSNGRDLVIEATALASGDQLKQLMLDSSLKNSLGKTLSNDVIIENDLLANLSLYIPLDAPSETSASGLVTLKNNRVRLPSINIEFERVNGQVAFTNEHVRFSELKALLAGQPITADYNSTLTDEGYRLDVLMEGNWDAAQSLSRLNPGLGQFADGPLDWNASINVTLGSSEYNYAGTFYSDVSSLATTLPSPLNIAENAVNPLRLDIRGNNQASNVVVNLKDTVTFEGVIPHKDKRFSRAHLSIGEADFFGLGMGFSISATMEKVEFEPWHKLVSVISDPKYQDEGGLFPAPSRIYVESDEFYIANQRFTDVTATARKNIDNWLLDFNADEAKAQARFFEQWMTRGIEVDAEFIRLDEFTLAENEKEIEWEPQALPRLDVYCRTCEISGNKLGEVEFEGYANDDGYKIDKISIRGDHNRFRAEGQWYKRNNDHYTFLNGDLDSSDFGAFLTDYKFDSGIKDSEADIEFALTWRDAPFEFEFAELDGRLEWELSDGYLTELSDKGSRIFTLLSLESLVRKLSLDFRDVFAKGFFYDNMQGSIQITQGKADTRDTSIDGGAGEMNIYGYTDLATKELNYNVNFTPKVTGNLPVLIYFMVNPPTAIAALALDQMLTSTKVISNINYSITGTLDQPILTETGRQSTEVELPARSDLNDQEEPFVPPSIEDAIKVEVNDS